MSRKDGLTFWKLVKISRPLFWIYFPLIFYLGVLFSGGGLDLYQILIMASMTFPLELAGLGLNDIYDYKSDLANPRKGGIQGYKLSKPEIKKLKIISYLAAIPTYLIVLLTGKIQFILTMFLFGLISYLYIVPPFRLKGKPILDLVSGGLVLILLPFAAGFSYHQSVVNLPWKIYIVTLYMSGLQGIAMTMDMKYDKLAGDKSTPIVFGARNTMVIAFLIFFSIFAFVNFSPLLHLFIGISTIGAFFLIFRPEGVHSRILTLIYVLVSLIFAIFYILFYWI
ncbi:MAG: hypothetical protein COY38_03250 [Candidatus Aenigmarchaeota archaeon CG_4_10_14_0_8_um_filter_37_24]|nr:UbiA family prenyltransferase [Candidatus Aenigmarchaeota archaeon]OIN87118.1 MAG: hypothetical protein AUJ50_03005 [Candidatus Aenigmarchaeota archaeon CG1_02_38_14]PIV68923.1 MAG: hypothetical protein COS07_02550 [Candidatus Aenigmarchaeota archaeon CG01_land_8_20_14_3_00_37_9]PIW41523.1 MAG: hypothetical protein COW21_01340 [Candidatus Aenigmarchaeota archaeon CG15_BIG_FIL_POST_REV_8_21_14_020_37_27]PIX51067.1 MAG: hypothetical protein COZ52_00685 [Candidatus Aenigmarchaeota archaeon CG_4